MTRPGQAEGREGDSDARGNYRINDKEFGICLVFVWSAGAIYIAGCL